MAERYYQLTEKGYKFFRLIEDLYHYSLAGDLATGNISEEDYPQFKAAGLNLSALVTHGLYVKDAGGFLAKGWGIAVGAYMYPEVGERKAKSYDELVADVLREGVQTEEEAKITVGAALSRLTQAGIAMAVLKPSPERAMLLDTKTGIKYASKSEAAVATAVEYGIEPTQFAWYEIIKQDPTRFKEVF